MVYLIAGDYRQALSYARSHSLRDNWKYIREERDLFGLHDPVIIRLGTWHLNSNIDAILDVVDERGFEILDSKF